MIAPAQKKKVGEAVMIYNHEYTGTSCVSMMFRYIAYEKHCPRAFIASAISLQCH